MSLIPADSCLNWTLYERKKGQHRIPSGRTFVEFVRPTFLWKGGSMRRRTCLIYTQAQTTCCSIMLCHNSLCDTEISTLAVTTVQRTLSCLKWPLTCPCMLHGYLSDIHTLYSSPKRKLFFWLICCHISCSCSSGRPHKKTTKQQNNAKIFIVEIDGELSMVAQTHPDRVFHKRITAFF